MKLLTFPEFVATGSMWQEDTKAIVGFFMTIGQVTIGRAQIASTRSDRVGIQVTKVIKQMSSSDEPPIETLVLSESDVLSCWHMTTFEQPKAASLVSDHFDEQLLLTLRTGMVTLYRASAFKAASGPGDAV
jgi:hypothetical protein